MKKRIMRVTGKGDLAKYLSLSGFGSLEDCWEKIEVRILSVSSFSEQEIIMNVKVKIGVSKKIKCSDRDLNPSLWLSLF